MARFSLTFTRDGDCRLAKVIIFTKHDNSNIIHDSVRAGALGYVLKSDAQRLLVTAIDTVAQQAVLLHGRGLGSVACLSDQKEQEPAERARTRRGTAHRGRS
jgi:DNA-binding NarL/FixJ family response regulator